MRYSPDSRIIDPAVFAIGFVELVIGAVTFCFVILFDIFSVAEKPAGIFAFVIISAAISAMLGYGILHYKKWARIMLIFFSGYVISLKILLFLGAVQFIGEIIKIPPPYMKDTISLVYHAAVIIFLLNRKVIKKFNK